MSQRDFFGIIVAVVGAVTVVLSTNTSDTRLDPPGLIHAMTQRVFIVYTAVYIAGAIVLSWLSEGQAGKRWVYVDVGLCALFGKRTCSIHGHYALVLISKKSNHPGGFTVLSTKALSTLLTLEWLDIFTEWITYPVIAVSPVLYRQGVMPGMWLMLYIGPCQYWNWSDQVSESRPHAF